MNDKGLGAACWCGIIAICMLFYVCAGRPPKKSDEQIHKDSIKEEAQERLNQEREQIRKAIREIEVQDEMKRIR